MSEEKNLEQQIIASLLISPRKIEIAEELGLLEAHFFDERMKELQSLFTWIFYLFI